MIVPKIGEICRANNKVGSATDLISLNFVIKITFLLLMINLGLITKFNDIKSVALPTLLLARHISPILGTIMYQLIHPK
jgi:uncharacterized membrane protein YkvI